MATNVRVLTITGAVMAAVTYLICAAFVAISGPLVPRARFRAKPCWIALLCIIAYIVVNNLLRRWCTSNRHVHA